MSADATPPTPAPANEWTIRKVLEWTTAHLKKHGSDTPRLDAEILLAQARGCQRIQLYTAYDQPLTDAVRATMRELVQRRAGAALGSALEQRPDAVAEACHHTAHPLRPVHHHGDRAALRRAQAGDPRHGGDGIHRRGSADHRPGSQQIRHRHKPHGSWPLNPAIGATNLLQVRTHLFRKRGDNSGITGGNGQSVRKQPSFRAICICTGQGRTGTLSIMTLPGIVGSQRKMPV